mmetsp:Transcript_6378/g.18201  ORF Transcript_6378/g.18201 Transcript_6378/m.18201 type:complete len:204 (+) Transcript_6378:288-899(+)
MLPVVQLMLLLQLLLQLELQPRRWPSRDGNRPNPTRQAGRSIMPGSWKHSRPPFPESRALTTATKTKTTTTTTTPASLPRPGPGRSSAKMRGSTRCSSSRGRIDSCDCVLGTKERRLPHTGTTAGTTGETITLTYTMVSAVVIKGRKGGGDMTTTTKTTKTTTTTMTKPMRTPFDPWSAVCAVGSAVRERTKRVTIARPGFQP